MPAAVPTVLIVTLGGTIAMTPTPEGGVKPALGPDELLAAVPQLADVAVKIETWACRQIPGASLTYSDLADLAAELNHRCSARAVDGVVVTQGTDTLEETSYLLSLLYHGSAPLIVTGAMRHPGLPAADGPGNLHAAVLAAADSQLASLGPLVLFNDLLYDPVQVRKSHTTSTAAFTAPATGPMGSVTEGQVRLFTLPAHRPAPLPAPVTESTARVGLYTAALGDDTSALTALLDHANLDGLVISAFGVGHVPATWAATLQEAAARMPVVLASRTGAGSTHTATYSFPGSESDLLQRGLIGAGSLTALQSRLLLTALLHTDADEALIRRTFAAQGTTREGRG